MNNNLPLVALIENCAVLSISSYSADVVVLSGGGDKVAVHAGTPDIWALKEESGCHVLSDVGGPIATALKVKEVWGDSKISVNISSGWIDGVLYINNRPVVLPEQLEQVVIYLPSNWGGELIVDGHYVGSYQIEAALHGKLKVSLHSSRTNLHSCAQEFLSELELTANIGAVMEIGNIRARGGSVQFTTVNSGSLIKTGRIHAKTLEASAGVGSKIHTGRIRCARHVELEASVGGSIIEVGHVKAGGIYVKAGVGATVKGSNLAALNKLKLTSGTSESLVSFVEAMAFEAELEASVSGAVDLGVLDCTKLNAKASVSGRIKVAGGSCTEGYGEASISGRVEMTGDFQKFQCKESIGGRVQVTQRLGTAGERFLAAGKRGFPRELWDDSHALLLAVAMAGVLAPALEENLSEALADNGFVTLVCQALPLAYQDAEFVDKARHCGAVLASKLSVDELAEAALMHEAMKVPEMQAAYIAAFQRLLAVVVEKATALAQ
jgi:hypothetical protein